MPFRPLIGGSITRKPDGSISFSLAVDEEIPVSALEALFEMVSACAATPRCARKRRTSKCPSSCPPRRTPASGDSK